VLAAIALTVATSSATPAAPPAIDDAIKQAAAAHRPLVIEFYTTWCGPCQIFDKGVLPLAEVQRAIGDVVFVRYDADTPLGREVAARYRIDAYPTFVVLDRHGVETLRRRGGLSEQAFLELVGEARKHW